MLHRSYPWHMRAGDTSALSEDEAAWDVQWNPESRFGQVRIEIGSAKNEMGWTVESPQHFAALRDWLTRAGSEVFIPLVNAIEQGQTPTADEFDRAAADVDRTIARLDAEARRRAMAEANARIATGRKERPRDSLVPEFTPEFRPAKEVPPLRRSMAAAAAVAAVGAMVGFVAGVLAPFSVKPGRGALGVAGTTLLGAIVALVIWHRSRE